MKRSGFQYILFAFIYLRENYVLFLFISLIVNSGCLKPIDMELEPHPVKLVVASQIIPNNFMIVSLTKSFSALANPTNDSIKNIGSDFMKGLLVENAIVTVSYQNRTDTLFMTSPGIYVSVSELNASNGFYTLHAKDPFTGQEILATSSILPKVVFDSIIPIVNKLSKDSSVVSVRYSIFDDPGTENWYMVNYYTRVKNDPKIANIDINSYFKKGTNKLLADFDLLSDKTFENNKYSKETLLRGVLGDDSIAVTLSNISEGYFQFLSAYKKSAGLFNALTGEPINYPSNVSNGYGYFNTHYPDIHLFFLKDY